MQDVDKDEDVQALSMSLKNAVPALRVLRDDVATHWGDENGVGS